MYLCHIQTRLANVEAEAELKVTYADELPTRQTQLAALKNTEEFDVLVVGGGATGAGCALDAVTRSKITGNRFSLSWDVTGFSFCNSAIAGWCETTGEKFLMVLFHYLHICQTYRKILMQ